MARDARLWLRVRCSAAEKSFRVRFSAVTRAANKHLEFVSAMYISGHVAPTATVPLSDVFSTDILYLIYNVSSLGDKIGL